MKALGNAWFISYLDFIAFISSLDKHPLGTLEMCLIRVFYIFKNDSAYQSCILSHKINKNGNHSF